MKCDKCGKEVYRNLFMNMDSGERLCNDCHINSLNLKIVSQMVEDSKETSRVDSLKELDASLQIPEHEIRTDKLAQAYSLINDLYLEKTLQSHLNAPSDKVMDLLYSTLNYMTSLRLELMNESDLTPIEFENLQRSLFKLLHCPKEIGSLEIDGYIIESDKWEPYHIEVRRKYIGEVILKYNGYIAGARRWTGTKDDFERLTRIIELRKVEGEKNER